MYWDGVKNMANGCGGDNGWSAWSDYFMNLCLPAKCIVVLALCFVGFGSLVAVMTAYRCVRGRLRKTDDDYDDTCDEDTCDDIECQCLCKDDYEPIRSSS